MILPDANLLLHAYDESSPFHSQASKWLKEIMNGTTPIILLPAVIFAFVKISTHSRIYQNPLSAAEASTHVRSWLARKHISLHDMLADDVDKALKLLENAGTAGNLTTDAQIAAVAIRLNAEIHTADLDFGRFTGVRFRNPILANQ